MKEIICYSPKYGNQIALVDDNDFEKVNQYRWGIRCSKLKNNNKFYAQCTKINRISMHQFIFGKVKKGCVIDHINGNSLDNTRSNLREATHSQQGQNKNSKNKYKGVSWNKNAKKYICMATGNYIGLFDDEKSAALEYDKYIIRNLGYEGSRLNSTYTQEEINTIKSELCLVDTRQQEKENRELPQNIYITRNLYQVQFKGINFKKSKTFKSLDLAIQFKEECLKEIENIEQEQKQQYYSQPINRNKEGIAFILINYEDKEYECLVDDDKWHDLTYNMYWYYSNGYVQTNINNSTKLIQRYLYEKYLSEKDISNLKIDHINRNKLDNRMSNLDPVTDGINNYNKETKNKWGYRGVSKNGKKFYAQLKHKGQTYCTTVFETIEEAALAYNDLSKKYYGDRAFINIVK